MKKIQLVKEIEQKGSYDVIVAGGGVSGVAAAVAAARKGKKALVIEKQINLGGLATTGLINLFTAMCNGRGVMIIKGMAEEFARMAMQYGWDTLPEDWKNDTVDSSTVTRFKTKFSAPIFMFQLTELLHKEGVDIMFDSVVTDVVHSNGHIDGLVIENKSGCSYYAAKMVVDATGDCEILTRIGVPCVQGNNYHTYLCFGADMETVQRTMEKDDFRFLLRWFKGGEADLWGRRHPEGKRYWLGTSADDVNEYLIENQLEVLEKIKNDDRSKRDLIQVPSMPQFRTTRHIDGDYTLTEADIYKHHETSIGTVCDFSKRDILYEIPFGALVKTGFDNVITAGRSAAADGFTWDVIRLIPPAIMTGQAAGVAVCHAIDENSPIYKVDIKNLQEDLSAQGVMIHFDDELIPKDRNADGAEEYVSDHDHF